MQFPAPFRSLAAALLGTAALTAAPAQADQVILDDLIVDGSLCVGFDCVNGESFGFDTIRLKENNLRIKFDDTSTAASFPRNDWQLTANDSANGGASKFSIDDISGGRTPFTVEANAPSHSLYVDDGGRIGSGTSTPSVEIHTIDGDTPTLRLQQDGSSGFAPQTWDVAGNETNFFVRDVTNGSALPFRIRPGAPTSSIFIDVDGDVGLGDSSPDASLDIEGSGAKDLEINSTDNDAIQIRLTTDSQSRRIVGQNAAGDDGTQLQLRNGQMRVIDIGTGDIVAEIDGTGITTRGPSCGGLGGAGAGGPCDKVFDPAVYTVPSIEDHAAVMWQNGHLPAVGPTLPGAPVNLTERYGRILNELEHAHIYIEQLNGQVTAQNARIEAQDAQIAVLARELQALR